MKKLAFISCKINLFLIFYYLSSNIVDPFPYALSLEMNRLKVALEDCHESA